ncbi:ADP-ribosylglycohydrolase family protein [Micromonospora soli]|uniref:ADP-ribosylglycohydrolase family protein n=1 Tax=Micromonospora sp. NBRC 110009 TaxID=3061627 RepID=UPI0026734922|nr:ADP-ribosylglycohydrolase family protein [Micromonospora sp. NBRC 110009]WKU02073.1 ADP-ribosylglycohydrolase family protein [Micromonospora sp. NBRC 110009]
MIATVIDSTPRRASGSLFGLAYGDALGRPTEFLTVAEIVRRYGPTGPRELTGDPALVTDDTQMALAVAWALHDAPAYTPEAVEPLLRRRFIDWSVSPENNRAPGMTCLRACAELDRGGRWQEATVAGSKGCGANMRVTPVGLLDVDLDTLAGLAQLQAGLTHGHPTGLVASELTAYAVRLLRDGAALADLPGLLAARAREQRTVYRHDWLGDLWQRPGGSTPEEFIARGWDECLRVLGRLDAALVRPDDGGDPCRLTGEGWIAEEALATALLCALRHPDDPVGALARGATTAGDSDSIAALAGAFVGTAHGMSAWPADWSARIEYADQLTALAAPHD